MSEESHTVHLDLTATEHAELIALFEKQIIFHKGYVNRALNNHYENDGKKYKVIETHENAIQFYENLIYSIKCQCW